MIIKFKEKTIMQESIIELNMAELNELFPEQIFLEFSEKEQQEMWELSQKNYSYKVARWNAYLNLLALRCFTNYLREEQSNLGECKNIFSDLPENGNNLLSSFWEFINGSAIEIGKFRLIMIPNDGTTTDELCIPQELVDIPELAGDYYLAVQVNLEQRYIRIWGYTTHQKIKQKSLYDNSNRYYILDQDNIIEDLNVLWVAESLNISEKSEISQTPTLSPSERKTLIQLLGKPTAYSPRLDNDFQDWASLLIDKYSRLELCQKRGCQIAVKIGVAQPKTKEPVTLMQKIEEMLNLVCDTVEPMIKPRSRQLITGFRNALQNSITGYKGTNVITLPEIQQEITLTVALLPNQKKEIINVLVEVSSQSQAFLPEQLKLVIMNPNQTDIITIQTECEDKHKSCKFNRKPEESFSIKLMWQDFEYHQQYGPIHYTHF
jgi:hypothetical protein